MDTNVRAILDRFGDHERSAVDLLALQQEATDRPRLYRVAYTLPRQPEDIEMSRWLSEWLCQHYLSEL